MDGNPQLPRASDGEIRRLAAMGIWLEGFEWESWGTFTFGPKFGEDGPSLDRGDYHFGRWINGQPDRPGYFYAVERGAMVGRVHVHALIAPSRQGLQPKRRSRWTSWFNRFGRCEILPYGFDRRGRLVSGAEWYLTKYLVKAPLTWKIGGRMIEA